MVENLACAASVEDAQSALSQLKENRVEAWSLPNEWYGQATEPALYAGSFDVLLHELLKIPDKFPAMQDSVEDLLLSWNYCLVQSNEGFFNLGTTRPLNSQSQARTLANPNSPGKWQGFGRLGFPTPARGEYPSNRSIQRFVPEALTGNSQTPLFKEKRFWKLYTAQCFPHPDTGNFYYRDRPFGPTRIRGTESKLFSTETEAYPFAWQSSCDAPIVEPVQATTVAETLEATPEVALALPAKPNEAAEANEPKNEQEGEPAPSDQIGDPTGVQQAATDSETATSEAVQSDQGQDTAVAEVVAQNNSTVSDTSAASTENVTANTETDTTTNQNTTIVWSKILNEPDVEIRRRGRLKRQHPAKTKYLSALRTIAIERKNKATLSPRLSDTIPDERVAGIIDSLRESTRINAFERKRRLNPVRRLRVQLSRKTATTQPAQTEAEVTLETQVETNLTTAVQELSPEGYGKTHADKVLFEVLSKKRIHKLRAERVRVSRRQRLAVLVNDESTSETQTRPNTTAQKVAPNRAIDFRLVNGRGSRQYYEAIDSFYGPLPIALATTSSYTHLKLARESLKRLQTSRLRRVQISRKLVSDEPKELESEKISHFPALAFESSKRLRPVKAARVRLSRKFAVDEKPEVQARLQPYALVDKSVVPEHDIALTKTGKLRRAFREIYNELMARAGEPHRRLTIFLSARPARGPNSNPAESATVATVIDRGAIMTRQRPTFWEIYQTLIARAREPHRRITLTLSARGKRAKKSTSTVATVTDTPAVTTRKRRSLQEIYQAFTQRTGEPHRSLVLTLSARPKNTDKDVIGNNTVAELTDEPATATRQRRSFQEIYQTIIARAREPHRRITLTLSARGKRDLTGATTVAAVTNVKRTHEIPNKYPGQYGIFHVNRRGRRQMTRATIWHVIKSRLHYQNRHNPKWRIANAYEVTLPNYPAAVISKRRHAMRIFGLESYVAMGSGHGNGKQTAADAQAANTATGNGRKQNRVRTNPVQRPPIEGPVLAALTPETVPAPSTALGSSALDTAIFVTTPGANGGNVSPIANVPPFRTSAGDDDHFHGFSGSFALNNTKLELGAEDNYSITSSVAYKPIKDSFFFLRSGITLNNSDEPISYTWGIGYDDWHPGTWGFEINNWNPLNPGDGLDLDNAVASLTRKFKADFLQNNNLASSLSLNKSINSEFALTWLVSWSPRPNWFVRTLITQSLEGNGLSWAYGFGYNDWRKNTISLEYNNWGFNEAFDTNFRQNALISLSYKWEF